MLTAGLRGCATVPSYSLTEFSTYRKRGASGAFADRYAGLVRPSSGVSVGARHSRFGTLDTT